MNNYLDISTPLIFDNGKTATNTVYSDRLFQWDSAKYNRLSQKHFGNKSQYWDNRSPIKIQAFLRDYIGDNSIVLCRIEKHENKMSGYPNWRFDYLK